MTAEINSILPGSNIIQIGNFGKLYISSDRDDWSVITQCRISVLIDLDGGLDSGVPTGPDEIIYIYFPIFDEALPNLERLHAVARFAADLCRRGEPVLAHCKMGLNRSALLLGVILTYLGLSGKDALELLRAQRPGALYNDAFAEYLLNLPAHQDQ